MTATEAIHRISAVEAADRISAAMATGLQQWRKQDCNNAHNTGLILQTTYTYCNERQRRMTAAEAIHRDTAV